MKFSAVVVAACLLTGTESFQLGVPSGISVRPHVSSSALHAKKVSFKEDSRKALAEGINQVANAVRVTLGPRGELLERAGSVVLP